MPGKTFMIARQIGLDMLRVLAGERIGEGGETTRLADAQEDDD